MPYECLVNNSEWSDQTPRIENGQLLLPDGPGWGADLNDQVIRAHPPREAEPRQYERGMG